MTNAFVAFAVRRSHALDFHRSVPVAGCGNSASVGSEADHGSVVAEAFAAELADIKLAPHHPHFGVAGVADMGIVRPDDSLGARALCPEEMLKRLEHVFVAQVPRLR